MPGLCSAGQKNKWEKLYWAGVLEPSFFRGGGIVADILVCLSQTFEE